MGKRIRPGLRRQLEVFGDPHPRVLAIIDAIRARGSDARDLRDAAHEAHHALHAKVPKGERWDRETIHRYVSRMQLGDQLISEVQARAVEQLVCAKFGVDPGSVEQWAATACFEALTANRIGNWPEPSVFAATVRKYMDLDEVKAAADAVIALASRPFTRKLRHR